MSVQQWHWLCWLYTVESQFSRRRAKTTTLPALPATTNHRQRHKHITKPVVIINGTPLAHSTEQRRQVRQFEQADAIQQRLRRREY